MNARWQCPVCGRKSDRTGTNAPVCAGSGSGLHRAAYMWRRQGSGYYARPFLLDPKEEA